MRAIALFHPEGPAPLTPTPGHSMQRLQCAMKRRVGLHPATRSQPAKTGEDTESHRAIEITPESTGCWPGSRRARV